MTPPEERPTRRLVTGSACINSTSAGLARGFTQGTEGLAVELETVNWAAADASCSEKVRSEMAGRASVRRARAALAGTVTLDAAEIGFVISKGTVLQALAFVADVEI